MIGHLQDNRFFQVSREVEGYQNLGMAWSVFEVAGRGFIPAWWNRYTDHGWQSPRSLVSDFDEARRTAIINARRFAP